MTSEAVRVALDDAFRTEWGRVVERHADGFGRHRVQTGRTDRKSVV